MSKFYLSHSTLLHSTRIKRYTLAITQIFFVVFNLSFHICFAQDYGDALVSGSIADARTLVPILASDSSSSEVCGMIYNGLIKYDKDINLIGDLAQSWEIQDDGLTIIFHLREGVSWHDGKPFTACDVEFTYQKLIDPLVRTPYSGDFQKIKSLEAIDAHTVKVTYKEPFSPGLASWAMPIMPKHLLEKEDLNSTAFSRRPVGSGPYRFKAWKAQEKIELTGNKEYFEGAPYISRSIYRVIPDEATLFLELQAQGIDSSGLTPLQYRKLTETNFFKQNYRKFRLESFSYTYLGFNLNNPLFKDKRIRQALNYAIDKNEIISGVLLGLGRITTGPFVPESWAYNHNIRPCEFSPQKAKELLVSSGWLDHDKDGWLDKEGMRFEFTIITNQGNLERQRVGEIIQGRLAALGIKVKLKVVEWSVFLSEFIDKRHFEAVLLGWSLGREPDNYDIWHSSKTKQGEFNFIGYSNPEVDRLLDEGRKTFDQNKRKEAYHRIHEIIYEEQPCIFLYVPDALPIVSSRFEGIKPAPIGIGYNFIEWWAPKSKQRYKAVIQR